MIDLYSRRLLGAATGLASRRRAGVRGDQDGRRRPRRPGRDLARGRGPAGRLPHRPRLDLYGAMPSPGCAASSGSGSRWAGSGRVSTTPPPRRSSPPWSGRSSSRHEFADTRQAQAVVLDWCYGFYNHQRRHSSVGMMSPINYENTHNDHGPRPGSRLEKPSTIRGEPRIAGRARCASGGSRASPSVVAMRPIAGRALRAKTGSLRSLRSDCVARLALLCRSLATRDLATTGSCAPTAPIASWLFTQRRASTFASVVELRN